MLRFKTDISLSFYASKKDFFFITYLYIGNFIFKFKKDSQDLVISQYLSNLSFTDALKGKKLCCDFDITDEIDILVANTYFSFLSYSNQFYFKIIRHF